MSQWVGVASSMHQTLVDKLHFPLSQTRGACNVKSGSGAPPSLPKNARSLASTPRVRFPSSRFLLRVLKLNSVTKKNVSSRCRGNACEKRDVTNAAKLEKCGRKEGTHCISHATVIFGEPSCMIATFSLPATLSKKMRFSNHSLQNKFSFAC